LLSAPDVPPRLARVGSLPDETRSGRHGKPGAARCPAEGRSIDDTAATLRRAAGNRGLAEGAGPDEADRESVLCQRAAEAVAPIHGESGPAKIQRRGFLPLLAHPQMLPHACGFALADQGADTRLIQDYLRHRNIQHTVRYTATNPGTVREALAIAGRKAGIYSSKMAATQLYPLAPRTLGKGLAQRTLKNLNFIQQVYVGGETEVHVVTQVINSLLALLVFPVTANEFKQLFGKEKLPPPGNLEAVRQRLVDLLQVSSLTVSKFKCCPDLNRFFERLRNAISHKHITFSNDPDSRCLPDVMLTFGDRIPHSKDPDYDWEITMNAEDLEKLVRYVGEEIINREW
jgi:HEPN pEK499 p136/Phage integrase family